MGLGNRKHLGAPSGLGYRGFLASSLFSIGKIPSSQLVLWGGGDFMSDGATDLNGFQAMRMGADNWLLKSRSGKGTTIAGWFIPDDTSHDMIIAQASDGANVDWEVGWNTSAQVTWKINYQNGSLFSGSTAPQGGYSTSLIFFMLRWDPNSSRVDFDVIQPGKSWRNSNKQLAGTAPKVSATKVEIGQDGTSYSERLDGAVDSFVSVGSLLSDAQRDRAYNSGDGHTASTWLTEFDGEDAETEILEFLDHDEIKDVRHGLNLSSYAAPLPYHVTDGPDGNRAARIRSAEKQLLKIPYSSDIEFGDRAFTIGFFFRYESLPSSGVWILGKDDPNFYAWRLLFSDQNGGRLRWDIQTDNGSFVSKGVRSNGIAGGWHYVELIHDPVNDRIGSTFDGSNVSWKNIGDGGLITPSNPLLIARKATSTELDGEICKLFFRNKVHTSSDTSYFYNAGSGRTAQEVVDDGLSDMIAFLNMDERGGNRYDGIGGHNAIPRSGNPSTRNGVATGIAYHDNDTIKVWENSTGGSPMVQTTATKKPILKKNEIQGFSSLLFQTDDFLSPESDLPISDFRGDHSILTVLKVEDDGDLAAVWGWKDDSDLFNGQYLWIDSRAGKKQLNLVRWDEGSALVDETYSISTLYGDYFLVRVDVIENDKAYIYVNGELKTSASVGSLDNIVADTRLNFLLGARGDDDGSADNNLDVHINAFGFFSALGVQKKYHTRTEQHLLKKLDI